MIVATLVGLLAGISGVASGSLYINPLKADDGNSYYTTPLYCTYTSLYLASYYNRVRSSYTVRSDRSCCYLADTRNKCCVVSDTGVYQECKCDPSVTCGITTTATTAPTTTTIPTTTAPTTTTIPTTTAPTTIMVSTTTASPSLCHPLKYRILNGQPPANACPSSQVFNITFLGGQISSCNTVFTTVNANGVIKPMFLTADICKDMIDQVTTPENAFEIHIGNNRYKLLAPQFTTSSGGDGTALIDVRQSDSHILNEVADCQQSVCPFNKKSMDGLVNFNSCKILSWGTSDSEQFSQNGLNEAALTLSSDGCKNLSVPEGASNIMCFKTRSGKNLICSSDSGAPVYCQARDSSEWILMGVAAFQMGCDETTEVMVISHPG